MAEYDFDKSIDRRGTGSLKVDMVSKNQMPEDTIPLWIADMDFETVPEVKEALIHTAEYGILGYPLQMESYFQAAYKWFSERFLWEPKEEWCLQTPGVIFALSAAVRIFTEERDSVLIQRPVYPPFTRVIEQNGRQVINNPLVYKNGKYQIDFDDFEKKIIEEQVKLFILCSPHNPVGRVWTREELQKMGDICLRHGVFVVADEIHCDFVYPGSRQVNFATLGTEFEQNCMICTAPSKTFNLAGLKISNVWIPNDGKRELMEKELMKVGFSNAGTFGMKGCEAAYAHGDKWLDELIIYLAGTVDMVRSFLQEQLPEVKLVEPEGTYLLWLDFSALGLTDEELERKMEQEARLWLDQGLMFGAEGSGFVRLNIASPRQVVKQALERLLVFKKK